MQQPSATIANQRGRARKTGAGSQAINREVRHHPSLTGPRGGRLEEGGAMDRRRGEDAAVVYHRVNTETAATTVFMTPSPTKTVGGAGHQGFIANDNSETLIDRNSHFRWLVPEPCKTSTCSTLFLQVVYEAPPHMAVFNGGGHYECAFSIEKMVARNLGRRRITEGSYICSPDTVTARE
eukprot:6181460-Pleurochrysis_carterae.AAC.1